jgi:DivIVA domain-containing protein
MDLTPQTLDEAEFREAKRGYNTQDVDEFLERVREGVVRKEAQLREALGRIDAAEARAVEAERQAADASSSDADETLKRTLVLAQRTADAAIKEAEEQAARTLAAAQDQSTRLLADAQDASARARAEAEAEARRAHEEARASVLAELQELEAARDAIHGDVDMLERHLLEQRDRLRDATRELQRLLDDPGALREVAIPTLATVSVPAAAAEPDRGPAMTPMAYPPAAEPTTGPTSEPVAEEPVEAEVAAEGTVAEEAAGWVPADDGWEDEATGAPSEATGPATEAIDMLEERDAGDDEYLAELRKAMTDEAPLGPREELEDDALDVPKTRFGRRR